MCLFAELVLATAQVNADSNAKKVEGKQNGQDSMRHERRMLAERVCMSANHELCCTSLEQACGSYWRLLPSISRCSKWG